MNTNHDNKLSIEKERLFEESVQRENNGEVEDSVSEIDETYLDYEIEEDISNSKSEEYECDTCDNCLKQR